MCVSLASSASYNTTTANSRATNTNANEVSEYAGANDCATNCAADAANITTRRSFTTSTTISNATRTNASRNKFNAE